MYPLIALDVFYIGTAFRPLSQARDLPVPGKRLEETGDRTRAARPPKSCVTEESKGMDEISQQPEPRSDPGGYPAVP